MEGSSDRTCVTYSTHIRILRVVSVSLCTAKHTSIKAVGDNDDNDRRKRKISSLPTANNVCATNDIDTSKKKKFEFVI